MKLVIACAKVIVWVYRMFLSRKHPVLLKELKSVLFAEEELQRRFFSNTSLFAELSSLSDSALRSRWNKKVEEVFSHQTAPEFYQRWTGDIGMLNIRVNVKDQVSRTEFWILLKKYISKNAIVLDYGCGTAVLSLSIAKEVGQLYLVDVKNTAYEYVSFKTSKLGHKNVIQLLPADFKFHLAFDIILCMDVLEHLETSAENFLKLHASLNPGGIIFLQAPWGGIPEHIEEAWIDWKRHRCDEILDTQYNLLEYINPVIPIKPGCLSAVYRKK
jgi:SAM-dependent methyltransferase